MSVLLALVPALAYPVSDVDADVPEPTCSPEILVAQPSDASTDLPTELAPSLLVSTCHGGTTVAVTVYEHRSDTVVYEDAALELAPSSWQGAQVVQLPLLSLEPDTSYDLVVDGEVLADTWTFTTGSHPGDVEVYPRPSLSTWLWQDSSTGLVNLEVSVGEDLPDGIYLLTSEELPWIAHGISGSTGWFELSDLPLSVPGEVCLQLSAVDVRGELHELATSCAWVYDESYEDYDDFRCGFPFGCSSTGAPAGLTGVLFGGLALLGLRRR